MSALLLLYLFAAAFVVLLADYRVSKNYFLNSKDSYSAKIMKEIFLAEYYEPKRPAVMAMQFSAGTVTARKKEQLQITVIVNKQMFVFFEPLRKIQEE